MKIPGGISEGNSSPLKGWAVVDGTYILVTNVLNASWISSPAWVIQYKLFLKWFSKWCYVNNMQIYLIVVLGIGPMIWERHVVHLQ